MAKMSIKKSFSAKARKARIDKMVSASVKPKAKTKTKPKATVTKTKTMKVNPKHAANRLAIIKAARDADMKAIAAKRKKK